MDDAYGASVRSTGVAAAEDRPQWAAVERAIYRRVLMNLGPIFVFDGHAQDGTEKVYFLKHAEYDSYTAGLCSIHFMRPMGNGGQEVFSVKPSNAYQLLSNSYRDEVRVTLTGDERVSDISERMKEEFIRITRLPAYHRQTGPEGANRMAVRIGACGYCFDSAIESGL